MTRTSEELRKSYEEALGKKMTAEQIIEECANRILEVRNETLDFVEKARRCIARLDEIALRPDPLSSIDYIDLMIETEKNKVTDCFLKRLANTSIMLTYDIRQHVFFKKIWRTSFCGTTDTPVLDFW